jgi:hypothetical protein
VEKLGGTDPFYDTISSPEHKVHFNIPLKGNMPRVEVPIKFTADATPAAAWERCARNALRFLHDSEEIGINALDYNLSNAERASRRCAILLEKLTESEGVYDFLYSKSLMVAEGIEFACDPVYNKALEMGNEMWNDHPDLEEAVVFYSMMEYILRKCGDDLSEIASRCRAMLHMDHTLDANIHNAIKEGLKRAVGSQSKSCGDYVKLNSKVSMF